MSHAALLLLLLLLMGVAAVRASLHAVAPEEYSDDDDNAADDDGSNDDDDDDDDDDGGGGDAMDYECAADSVHRDANDLRHVRYIEPSECTDERFVRVPQVYPGDGQPFPDVGATDAPEVADSTGAGYVQLLDENDASTRCGTSNPCSNGEGGCEDATGAGLCYPFRVQEPGTYRLTVRLGAAEQAGGSNSVFVAVGATPEQALGGHYYAVPFNGNSGAFVDADKGNLDMNAAALTADATFPLRFDGVKGGCQPQYVCFVKRESQVAIDSFKLERDQTCGKAAATIDATDLFDTQSEPSANCDPANPIEAFFSTADVTPAGGVAIAGVADDYVIVVGDNGNLASNCPLSFCDTDCSAHQGAKICYAFQVRDSGTYSVSLEMAGASDSQDSFFVALGDDAQSALDGDYYTVAADRAFGAVSTGVKGQNSVQPAQREPVLFTVRGNCRTQRICLLKREGGTAIKSITLTKVNAPAPQLL